MVAVCQATRGLWTGHPIKWLICLLTDQGSFRAGPHGLSSAQAWRAVGPPWPAMSVNGAGIRPNIPAKPLGITPSPVSLTPTSKPSVSSCLQQSGARSRSAPLLQLAASAVTTSTPVGGGHKHAALIRSSPPVLWRKLRRLGRSQAASAAPGRSRAAATATRRPCHADATRMPQRYEGKDRDSRCYRWCVTTCVYSRVTFK